MKNNTSTAIEHPIVIVGSPRSGTTLLRTILNQHPDLLVYPDEPQFILEMYQRYGTTVRNVPAAIAYLAEHRYVPDSVGRETLQVTCLQAGPVPLRYIIACYLRVWGGDNLAAHRIVLKHPELVLHLDLVNELFPEAHIVHIVRDPRANVSSQRARWPQFTVWECSMKWRNAVQAALKWQDSGKTSFSELRYEDLLLTPEQTLRTLCQSLNIPFTAEMLSFNQRETVYTSGGIAEEKKFTAPDPSRLTAWQDRMSTLDICLIEACCKKEMALWDYKLEQPPEQTNLPLHLASQKIHYRYRVAGRRVKSAFRTLGWRSGWIT